MKTERQRINSDATKLAQKLWTKYSVMDAENCQRMKKDPTFKQEMLQRISQRLYHLIKEDYSGIDEYYPSAIIEFKAMMRYLFRLFNANGLIRIANSLKPVRTKYHKTAYMSATSFSGDGDYYMRKTINHYVRDQTRMY